MKTLIIEFQTSGHYPEYLKHVLNEINNRGKQNEFLIYLTPKLKPHLKIFDSTNVFKSITFFDDTLASLYSSFSTTKQMANLYYQQILEIQKQRDFTHVLFLNLSLVIQNFNLLNPFKKLPFSFSGILMNSPYRIREKKGNTLLQYKRELPLRLLLWNRKCSKIFLLNDKKGVRFYNNWSSKIDFINDPVRINSSSYINIYNYHNIKLTTLTFLQIGKLGKYKGTLNIIDAFSSLEPNHLNKVHLLLIGKVNRDTNLENNKLQELQKKHKISIRNEFIADEDFSAYVQQSHVIIIANKNVENSSGIVNHCLANNKVVIAPDKGYYKQAFKSYKAVVSYNDDFTLKNAIEYTFNHHKILQLEAAKYDSENYITQNSSTKFAKTIIDHII